jgi:hypothetical protein
MFILWFFSFFSAQAITAITHYMTLAPNNFELQFAAAASAWPQLLSQIEDLRSRARAS